MAEILANYFTDAALNIGGDHVNNLTEEDNNEHNSVRSVREGYKENNFDFKLFTTVEVQQAIEKVNPKKSSGWDSGISPKLLKNVAKGTTTYLTKLYNKCTEKGEMAYYVENG